MSAVKKGEQGEGLRKPVVWLHGEVKTPPFTLEDSKMDVEKRKAIEAAGWKVGDGADFLEMNDEERQLLDTRVALALAIRNQRKVAKLSQKQLGAKLKTSQPRIAKIERAASDVSMDQLVRALTAAGGRIVIRSAKSKVAKKKPAKSSKGDTMVLEVTTSRF
jgi:predicted XRE-type DNA-binding protein